jgi:general secretion pathway protein G
MFFQTKPALKSKTSGFTLVELLIAIVIISVLAVIGINNFISSQMKSRDAQRKNDLSQIAKSLEMDYNDKGRYPDAEAGLILNLAWGSSFTDTTVTNGAIYMPKLPQVPGGGSYYYTIEPSGTGYKIYANLENTKDRAVNPVLYPGTDCGSGVECNFGMASSNLTL